MSKVSDKLIKVLLEKKSVVTRAFLWKIPHHSGRLDVRLKLGRYSKPKKYFGNEEPESLTPKSELTLDEEEFSALTEFLRDNYEPFRQGFRAFIPLEAPYSSENAEQIRNLFSLPDTAQLVKFITSQNLIPDALATALETARRMKAILELEAMLSEDLVEQPWQEWFESNSWVLGSEFVKVLEDRRIDVGNIADFLMQAYDGFVDIVEIKRPGGTDRFWRSSRDHGNCIPSSGLVEAIAQASRYIYEVERESNSVKFLERIGNVRTVKPRGILLFGRSSGWDEQECEAYRVLNSSYHNLTIMSYDHVLERAKRMVGHDF